MESLELTDRVLFGILTQPMHRDQPKRLHEEKTEYILQEHVKYLEAAGARVVPVSFLLPRDELVQLLGKLNGLYVPGDHKSILDNEDYHGSVETILRYATEQNKFYNAFPVVFTEFSFILMLQQAGHASKAAFTKLPSLALSAQQIT